MIARGIFIRRALARSRGVVYQDLKYLDREKREWGGLVLQVSDIANIKGYPLLSKPVHHLLLGKDSLDIF